MAIEMFDPIDKSLSVQSRSLPDTSFGTASLHNKVFEFSRTVRQFANLIEQYSEVQRKHRPPSNPIQWLFTPIDAGERRDKATNEIVNKLSICRGRYFGIYESIMQDLEYAGRDVDAIRRRISGQFNSVERFETKEALSFLGFVLATIQAEAQ